MTNACVTRVRAAAKFCDECGTAITSTAVPASPAEYKHVTVLFADVVHSMDIATALGPERLREIMTEVMTAAAAVAYRLGRGDGMTVFREVLTVIGVGGMGQAIARRLGPSKTVLLADNNEQMLTSVAASLSADGYDVESQTVDVSSPESVRALAGFAGSLGNVTQLAHTAGLSPAQASAEAILAVDLLGVALVLKELGAVIAPGGAGVVIASMAGHLFPPLSADQEKALAHLPPEELLALDFLNKVKEPNFAYPIAKQANLIRVRAASAQWGTRGARINSISPGIISTPMGQQELASPVGDGMRAMIAMSGTGRIGTPDDIAAAAAFLLGSDATFITGADLLVDGGVVAALKAGSQTR